MTAASSPDNDPGRARHEHSSFRHASFRRPAEALFSLALTREIQCYVSDAILAEYEDVLHRARLAIQPDKADVAIARIRAAALPVLPASRVVAALDPDDNIFLECAEAGHAHYLVTGNSRHFPERWAATQIVTPRQFMDAYALVSDEPG